MRRLENYLMKKAVTGMREHAVRELDRARDRLMKSDSTELLNFMNSGITINLKALKIHALDMVRQKLKPSKRS